MTVFSIIQVLSVLLNLTNGSNETNGISQLQGSSTLSADLAQSVIQPFPLGHPSPVVSAASGPTPQKSHAFPYLMSRPIFTETLKSSTQLASGESKKAKESVSGWKQNDDANWSKHGGEEGLDKSRNSKGQGSYHDGSHKKSLGHDNRDAKEKWKQGSESGEHENDKLVEEYNKNKGRVYEKKWSWEKERGSGHGWENAGHADQNHSKGSNLNEHQSGMKSNQGKEAWSQDKKLSHGGSDYWGSKHMNKGLRNEDNDGHHKESNNMKKYNNENQNDRKYSYL